MHPVPASGDRVVLAARCLRRVEGDVQGPGGRLAHHLPHAGIRLGEGLAPVVHPEQVEAFDVQDDGPGLHRCSAGGGALGKRRQDLREQDGQQARFGTDSGDAGEVAVAAQRPEQVVEVHLGGAAVASPPLRTRPTATGMPMSAMP